MATDRPGAADDGAITADDRPGAAAVPPAGVGARTRTDGPPARGRLASGLLAVVVCGLTGSVVLVPLAGLGWLRPVPGLALVALATVALLVLWRPDRAVAADADAPAWFLSAALAVAALAVGPSLAFAHEHAVVDRDPGIYVTTAVHARAQADLTLPPASGPFGTVPGIIERTSAQPVLADGSHGFQGLHLLPTQAAALGWVGGDGLTVRTGALLAGVGLVLLMALARRVVGAPLALVAGAALATTLPFALLSRDLYSEWPLFALVAGGLWALDAALAERSVPRAVVAGAALGAATTARIDGLVTVSGLVLVVGLWAALAPPGPARATRSRVALAAAVPAGLGWALGMVDGWTRSRSYLTAHRTEILAQVALPVAALVAVAVVAVVGRDRLRALADRLPSAGADRASTGGTRHSPWPERAGPTPSAPAAAGGRSAWVAPRSWAIAAGLAVVALGVVAVVLRPAWPSGEELPPSAITAGLQEAEGEPVDPGRTYAELSGRWLVWYLGPATVAAAVLAGAVGVGAWLRGRRVRVEALVAAVVGPPLVLYLARPSIYPDHPWASRRFLPAVLPGLLLAAAWLARWLWDRRAVPRWGAPSAAAAVLVAVAMVAHPVVVLAPLVRARQHTGQVAMVRELCREVPADAALLTVALPAEGWVPSLTAFCDRPVGGALDPEVPDPTTVEELARAWAAEGRPLWIVGPSGSVLTPLGARPAVSVSAEDELVLRNSLTERPGRTRDGRTVLVAGPVTAPT